MPVNKFYKSNFVNIYREGRREKTSGRLQQGGGSLRDDSLKGDNSNRSLSLLRGASLTDDGSGSRGENSGIDLLPRGVSTSGIADDSSRGDYSRSSLLRGISLADESSRGEHSGSFGDSAGGGVGGTNLTHQFLQLRSNSLDDEQVISCLFYVLNLLLYLLLGFY